MAQNTSAPDLQAFCLGEREDIVRPGSRNVDPGCGVGLSPAVIVLASGKQDLFAAGVVGQAAGWPQPQELGRKVGMVGLGDNPQTRALVEDDQSAIKDSPTHA
jgi:hypothetical protein